MASSPRPLTTGPVCGAVAGLAISPARPARPARLLGHLGVPFGTYPPRRSGGKQARPRGAESQDAADPTAAGIANPTFPARGSDMKASIMTFVTLAAALALGAVGAARAQTVDDVNWINKCIADHKDEGQTRAVLVAYCTCMNTQMSASETRSISEWEKTHKKEADACGKKAGWK